MANNKLTSKCISILNELEDMTDNAPAVPLGRDKIIVSRTELEELLIELRNALPSAVSQGESIIKSSERIIQDAQKKAREIERDAERKAQHLINDSEIVLQANRQAEEIITNANARSREIFNSVKAYCEGIFTNTDNELGKMMEKTKKSRQSLKNLTYTDFENRRKDLDQD